ncbi:MAG TPA: alpha/beta hydrolase-fold protein [Chloroflexota bacterium]
MTFGQSSIISRTRRYGEWLLPNPLCRETTRRAAHFDLFVTRSALMNREYHRWYSRSLGRDMELLEFGHDGPVALVFPTSMGRFYELEDRGMVAALADRLDGGRLRLFCLDSIDGESWYHTSAHPRQRVERHLQYERYVLDEVLPLARSRCAPGADDRVITTGCSLGAFHAALLTLRHPFVVRRTVALSGKYDNSSFLDGYSDGDTYLTNPFAFLPGLNDSSFLDALRAATLVIVTGSTDPHVDEARRLSRLLWEKGVPNTLDVWEGWMHDWPYWQAMITKFL